MIFFSSYTLAFKNFIFVYDYDLKNKSLSQYRKNHFLVLRIFSYEKQSHSYETSTLVLRNYLTSLFCYKEGNNTTKQQNSCFVENLLFFCFIFFKIFEDEGKLPINIKNLNLLGDISFKLNFQLYFTKQLNVVLERKTAKWGE